MPSPSRRLGEVARDEARPYLHDMKPDTPILSRRIGARVFHSGVWFLSKPGSFKCSWPLGRLSLFEDRLEIAMLLQTFVIPWRAIDDIRHRPPMGEVQISHHESGVPDQVYVRGLVFSGFYYRLVDAARRLRVPVSLS